jgi:two-component system, cell cycle sensor histidine kinase and response regulator CckA
MHQTPVQSIAPDRLAAMWESPLFDSPPEEAFDRLTRMAARLLGAPVAFISVLGEDRQFFKSATGVPEPWATRRDTPLAYTFCRQVVETAGPLVVQDARRDPLLRVGPAVRELGWIAYAGVPLAVGPGPVIGTLAVVDAIPRLWSERDVGLLQDIAASAASELELRTLRAGNGRHPHDVTPTDVFAETGVPMALVSPEGRWLRVNRGLCELLGASPGELLGNAADESTHPDDRAADLEALRLLRTGEVTTYSGEKRCLRKSGEALWVLATVTAVLQEGGGLRHLIVALQDVSDRRRAEASLRESEERYRLAARASGGAMREWDFTTDRLVWSEGLEAAFGEAVPGPVTAAWWYERIHPEDRDRVLASLRQALARRERSREEEYRFRRGDGSWARVTDRVSLLSDAMGRPSRLIGVMTETGERPDPQAEPGPSGARYRSLVDNLREVVFRTDAAGRWELLNPAWEELTGFTADEVIGTPFLDYVHPEDRSRCAREFERLLKRRLTASRSEVRCLTRDGGFRWAEVRARPIQDDWGEPAGTSGTLTDITDRKFAESLSAGQSRLLEEIAAGAPLQAVLDGIARFSEEHASPGIATLMLLDQDGKLLRLASAPRLPDTLRSALEVVPVGPSHGSCGTAAFRRERVVVRDIANDPLWAGWPQQELVLAAGLQACWSVPILSAGGDTLGTFAIYYVEAREPEPDDLRIVQIASHLAKIAIERQRAQDERQVAEEALRRSEEQLRQAHKMEAVGQLAGGIAHDFNNLLTGVLTYCDLILQDVHAGDPIRGDIEQIRHAGQRAAGLTRQLLAFSRRQVLQPRVLSLNAVVNDLDGMLRRLIRADIVMESELDPSLWYVLADPGQVEQVLVNLVVNARDATPHGGRIVISTANRRNEDGSRPGAYATLTVTDTGHGMDAATRARIFDPFFTTKEPGKGTGLGLSSVYGIVEQSGGYISVESAPGEGATFTVCLPRYDGAGDAVPSRAERRSLPGGSETLLLVEDETAVRSSTRRLLERHGYAVLEARHGADALRTVDEAGHEVDLVVTDVVMPEMGGRELVDRLRARRPGLKVLYMSGYTQKAIATDGIMPPRTGFVEKPFTMEQLLRRLRELLDE